MYNLFIYSLILYINTLLYRNKSTSLLTKDTDARDELNNPERKPFQSIHTGCAYWNKLVQHIISMVIF
jgi:hypothetical protein